MSTYIEHQEDADTARARLEDHLNEAVTALVQSRHRHYDLAYEDGSTYTESARAALEEVVAIERELIDYQQMRANVDPDEAHEYDLAEQRWEEARDLAASGAA